MSRWGRENDAANCGSCGNLCPPSKPVCRARKCRQCTNDEGCNGNLLTCCPDGCFNLRSDQNNRTLLPTNADLTAEVFAAAGLADAVRSLPIAQRDAVVARVVEERPYPEIAVAMACSELMVRQRVSRGLRNVRSQIEESR